MYFICACTYVWKSNMYDISLNLARHVYTVWCKILTVEDNALFLCTCTYVQKSDMYV